MSVVRWSLVSSLLVMGGCSPTPEHLQWSVGFESEELEAEAVAVTAWIVRGGCDGNQVVYENRVGMVSERRPSLHAGRYGIGASARAGDCSTIAESCVDLHLPLVDAAAVELTLVERRRGAACQLSRCMDGECQSNTGGNPDLGTGDLGVTGIDAGPDCSDGVRRDGGHCYRFYETEEDWGGAQDVCVGWGGDLVVLEDASEETWLTTKFSPAVDFWLGISDATTEGIWLTAEGNAVSYFNWDTDPQNPDGGTSSNCARFHVGSGMWRDFGCTSLFGFFCERD